MKYVIESPLSKKPVNAVSDIKFDAGKQISSLSIKQQTISTNPQLLSQLTQSLIANFNELPDCGYVRQPVLLALLGCSRATLWRWVKAGRVPSPIKLGLRISAWNIGQLRAYFLMIEAMGAINSTGDGK